MSSDIGLARKQTVFAIKEAVTGTLIFPTANDYIVPAGNAVLNQTPSFSDSEELVDSLDIIDQFQNATPPGEFTIPMYARPSGTVGNIPQGSVLFESLMGSISTLSGMIASVSTLLSISATSLDIDTIADDLPERGIILIDSEQIWYDRKSQTLAATTGTLSGLTRGYNSTTATNHAADVSLYLKSVYYAQQTTSPSFSLWVKTDHFVQGLSGCSVNQMTIGVNNEGGVMLTFTGQGMKMVWAGKDELTAGVSATSILPVVDGDRYSANSFIWNVTADDNNSGSGYEILSISGNNLTIDTAVTWTIADVIQGYLPTGVKIGSVVESKDTSIELNNVTATLKTGDLTVGCPKQYIIDEIGTTYPLAYVENVRAIETTAGIYFRKADAKYFAEGFTGNEVPVQYIFGDTSGYKMRVYMKKCQLQVPTISFTTPTVELSIPIKALGTDGEDSCDILFE